MSGGKKYKDAAERYADGWRFHRTNRRWIRVEGGLAGEQRKLIAQASELEVRT